MSRLTAWNLLLKPHYRMNPTTTGTMRFRLRLPDKRRSAYFCTRLLYEVMPVPIRSALNAKLGSCWQSYCPVCQNKVRAFAPLPDFYARSMEQHGSELRLSDFETCNFEAYQCPHCGATDRDRLYALFLRERLPSEQKKQEVFHLLDIAPAHALSLHIRRNYQLRHRTADLFQQDVDDCVDVTQMDCYASNSFDAFICSHVLEHVENDRKAMGELYRVLKPGGWGIAMVPICSRIEGVREDPACTDQAQRWKLFGQGDHVRLYSRAGFSTRLQEAGFLVQELRPGSLQRSERCGLSPSTVLYVVEKPGL